MFETEKLDAVLVCTPPQLAPAVLRVAHGKGVHAFVEKPLATSLRDATELAGLYETRELVNQVGYVNRFNDVFVRAKSFLDEGLLGRVVRFRSEMHSRTVIRENEETGWRAARASGGGAIFEMASHAIDLAIFFFGQPTHVAGTCLSQVFSKQVEDVVSSTFLYPGGLCGSLYVNWSDESYRKPSNKIEVFGTRGKLLADQHGLKLHLSEADSARGLREGWNSLYITDVFSNVPFFVRGIEFTAQLHHFIDRIDAGRGARTRCTFRDGAATLAIIEQMFADCERLQREAS
jgi:predicted dehydrogenase